MKKIIILVLSIVLLTGCGNKQEPKEEKIVCDMKTTTITITVKNGKIIKYIDKVQGEITSDEVNILNESYLEGIDNNRDAINKLKEVIASTGGECK